LIPCLTAVGRADARWLTADWEGNIVKSLPLLN